MIKTKQKEKKTWKVHEEKESKKRAGRQTVQDLLITQHAVRWDQCRTAASGSANEFVAVGGQLGSSEQQNEGRLLVSEMASGLQQQEAELCRPSLFCTRPAKSPISTEKC